MLKSRTSLPFPKKAALCTNNAAFLPYLCCFPVISEAVSRIITTRSILFSENPAFPRCWNRGKGRMPYPGASPPDHA